jgi:hypothetical protein
MNLVKMWLILGQMWMDGWTDLSLLKGFLVCIEYCLIMEGYEQVIIVCYMKLEGPFSGFLFAVL